MVKTTFFLLLLVAGFQAHSQQKLKDLLYGGKLKLDSNSVVRKGDDLSTKIDTATKKPVEVVKPVTVATQQTAAQKTDTPAEGINNTATTATQIADEPATSNEAAAPVKSNSKIWKEYIDSFSKAMKTDLGAIKKLKKGEHFVTVQYEIGLDGQTTILSVVADPENALLQSEVKTRLELSVPKLAPVTDSSGKVRKVKRTSNFVLTKE